MKLGSNGPTQRRVLAVNIRTSSAPSKNHVRLLCTLWSRQRWASSTASFLPPPKRRWSPPSRLPASLGFASPELRKSRSPKELNRRAGPGPSAPKKTKTVPSMQAASVRRVVMEASLLDPRCRRKHPRGRKAERSIDIQQTWRSCPRPHLRCRQFPGLGSARPDHTPPSESCRRTFRVKPQRLLLGLPGCRPIQSVLRLEVQGLQSSLHGASFHFE